MPLAGCFVQGIGQCSIAAEDPAFFLTQWGLFQFSTKNTSISYWRLWMPNQTDICQKIHLVGVPFFKSKLAILEWTRPSITHSPWIIFLGGIPIWLQCHNPRRTKPFPLFAAHLSQPCSKNFSNIGGMTKIRSLPAMNVRFCFFPNWPSPWTSFNTPA